MKYRLILPSLVAALFLSTGLSVSAQPQSGYIEPLMSQEEMFQFHERMRYARTPQEREQIRLEHHQLMQQRANARGFSIPDLSPMNDGYRHMGPGYMAPGYMGPGYMGPGHMNPGYMGPGNMGPGYMQR